MEKMKKMKDLCLACFILMMFVFGLIATGYAAEQKRPGIKIEKEKKRLRLSPGAEARDPHWRGSPRTSEGGCSGVDLTVRSLELSRSSHGIFARAKIINRCNGSTRNGAVLCFKASGEPGVYIEVVGPGWAGPHERWSSWYGVPGDTSRSPFTVTATIDSENTEPEVNEGNNTCTASISAGETSKTKICP